MRQIGGGAVPFGAFVKRENRLLVRIDRGAIDAAAPIIGEHLAIAQALRPPAEPHCFEISVIALPADGQNNALAAVGVGLARNDIALSDAGRAQEMRVLVGTAQRRRGEDQQSAEKDREKSENGGWIDPPET